VHVTRSLLLAPAGNCGACAGRRSNPSACTSCCTGCVAQLFFEKLGPGVPPEAATFVGLAVMLFYNATHVFSTTPSLQNRKRCAGGMIGGQECPYSSNYTFLDSTDLVESKNICLDFLACLKKSLKFLKSCIWNTHPYTP
jgi:hypothetical protein